MTRFPSTRQIPDAAEVTPETDFPYQPKQEPGDDPRRSGCGVFAVWTCTLCNYHLAYFILPGDNQKPWRILVQILLLASGGLAISVQKWQKWTHRLAGTIAIALLLWAVFWGLAFIAPIGFLDFD